MDSEIEKLSLMSQKPCTQHKPNFDVKNLIKFRKKLNTISNKKEELEKAKFRIHNVSKLLFFSSEQLQLVMKNSCMSIVLWGDYGSGKKVNI